MKVHICSQQNECQIRINVSFASISTVIVSTSIRILIRLSTLIITIYKSAVIRKQKIFSVILLCHVLTSISVLLSTPFLNAIYRCTCKPSAKELLYLSIFFRATFIASTDSSAFFIDSAMVFFSLPFATSFFNLSSTRPFSTSVIF